MRCARKSLAIFLGLFSALFYLPASNATGGLSPAYPYGDDESHPTAEETYAEKTQVTHEEMMERVGAGEQSVVPLQDVSLQIGTPACTFFANGDDVHVSTYSGIRYASGHGWWKNNTCPAGTRATVTVWLEEKLGGVWYPQGDAAEKSGRLPGSGSSQRVNAKMKCVNNTPHFWRSIIVVDLDGRRDTTPAAYTSPQSLNCY